MAADTKIHIDVAKTALDAVVDGLDAGSGAAVVRIYSVGSGVPADCETSITDQVVLAELTCTDPAFGDASDDTPNAVATAAAITSCTNAVAGTASFFRGVDSDGRAVLQGTVGTTDSDMIVNTTTIASGATFAITAWTVTLPEG